MSSQDYIDPEILSDFFLEAKEHLETIEPNLLELEKNPQDLSLLNEIFRPMHSLKGASGFLGLDKIKGLAHKSESILDELRKGAMTVTPDIMDIILSATDALRTMVENLESSGSEGDVDTAPIIARIEGALKNGGAASPAAAKSASAGVAGQSPAAPSGPDPSPAEAASAGPVPAGAAPEGGASAPAAPETAPQSASPAPSAAPAAAQGPMTIRWQNVQYEAPDFDATPYALTIVGEGHLTDFLEEAHELVENMNRDLLALEKNPEGSGELVNDLFRYFHNLKGNSGIIGYRELNALTHEAETLLNRVRKGEMHVSHGIIDLLLAVADLIEDLLDRIDVPSGKTTPRDISLMAAVLAATSSAGELTVPEAYAAVLAPAMEGGQVSAGPAAAGGAEAVAAPQPEEAPVAVPPTSGHDAEDVAIFEQTASQQLKNLDLAMDLLHKDATQRDVIDGLYRTLTTIQNACGYMGLGDIRTYAERTADLVDKARHSDMDFGLMLDMLRQEFSIIKDMVKDGLTRLKAEGAAKTPEGKPSVAPAASSAAAEAPAAVSAAAGPVPAEKVQPAAAKPAPAKPAGAKPAGAPTVPAKTAPAPAAARPGTKPGKVGPGFGQKGSSTIRVDHQKLDHLMNLIGELIINRNRYSMLARALEEGHEEVAEVAQQLTETTYAMARISDDLQDTIMKVRMVPVHTVFSRFPRLVRDLSRKSGKQVELITEGEETELDKSVGEEIGDPLVHLIRNSVDHGIEPEAERIAAGKSPTGHVWLRAYHKGNSVAIEVEDDGCGIDPEKMRQVAVKKGMMTAEEAKLLDDRQAIDIIFLPGFSSSEKITEVSGRGVGMDVVKTNIKNLKGSIQINTEVGRGTRFTLTLPLTLAIIDALMVQVGKAVYAIPLDAVSETTKIEAERLSEVNHRKALTLRGEVLGIVELSELLALPSNTEKRTILPVVIIHDNERRLGVVVDRLLERQEIVIKPLGQYLNTFDIHGISGATIMGDGSVVLILDPHEIYRLATATIKQPAYA